MSSTHLMYCRKSSESEERQILSIPAQKGHLEAVAERESFVIDKKYQESMSAKSPGRPVFQELLAHISKGNGTSLLVWNIDRLARNMIDGGHILQLMDDGKILQIQTNDRVYHNTPDDKFMMSLSFGIAKKYVDDLSVNVKRGNLEKVKRGEWPNRAPIGFLNDVKTKTLAIDKKLAPFVKQTYELYATGNYSLQQLTETMFNNGFRTASGKKVFKSQIHKILGNPLYAGLMEYYDKTYQGTYRPIVDLELHKRVKTVMENASRPRGNTLFFPLRGLMTCAHCGCMLTASLKKGHHYYYCTNGKGICEQHKSYLRENLLYDIIAEQLEKLAFTEKKINLVFKAVEEARKNGTQNHEHLTKQTKNLLERLKQKESRLLDTFLADQVSQELYSQKCDEIKQERVTLTNRLKELENDGKQFTLEPVREMFLRGSRAKKEFLEADDAKKRSIAKSLLWNLSIENKSVAQIKYKSPYHILANTPKNASILTLLPEQDSNIVEDIAKYLDSQS